jgi:hypothetical protein
VNAQEVESKVDNLNNSTLQLVAIHELELIIGVDAKDIEAFVIEEIAPIYNKIEVQKFIFVKGVRGIRTGKYAFILTFESIEDRDRIYPPSGEIVADFGEDSMWEKFTSMATGIGITHTDYVKVTH